MNHDIKIHIDYLGPVRNSDIMLKPFMVFTGESGTGKSYTALLVHYIYKVMCNSAGLSDFYKSLNASYDEDKQRLQNKEEGLLFEFTRQQFEDWVSNSAIKYVGNMLGIFSMQGKVSVQFDGLDDKYSFYYKKEKTEVNGEEVYLDNLTLNGKYTFRFPNMSSNWESFPYELLTGAIFGLLQSKTFLLPPSRGGLVCLNDTGRGDYRISQAGMYNEFIRDLSDLKTTPNADYDFTEYLNISKELINGKIDIRDNELFYEQDFGDIPISAAAASIKELAPFAIMLQKGLISKYSITFEEPETNLHPEMQIKTADIIAKLLQRGCRFTITTHSDYFLQRINQLIKLGMYRKNRKLKGGNDSVIDSNDIYLDKESIGAYYFDKSKEETATFIRTLDIGENGIPFSTFFDSVRKLSKEENRINDLLEDYGDKY